MIRIDDVLITIAPRVMRDKLSIAVTGVSGNIEAIEKSLEQSAKGLIAREDFGKSEADLNVGRKWNLRITGFWQ